MGVLFERQLDGKYKDWCNNRFLGTLTVSDKIGDIIVTHSRVFVLLYDSVIYLSGYTDKKVNSRLEAAIKMPKKFDKGLFLKKLHQNVQECMQDKECPYDSFWQQVDYYNSWCTTGENWDIIQRELQLFSLNKVLTIMMNGIGIEKKKDYGEFALDLLEMNLLRNRVAHGDIAVRLAAKVFNQNMPTNFNKSNNPFTDVDLIYEQYMCLAEKWKGVFDAGPKCIIKELGGSIYE